MTGPGESTDLERRLRLEGPSIVTPAAAIELMTEAADALVELRTALAEAVDGFVEVLGPLATTQPIADDLARWRALANPLFAADEG